MRTPRSFWLGLLLVGATFTGCAGGRGSSGFDISENAAIGQAIDTKRCVDYQGLTICPADNPTTPVVTASPTATPTASMTPYTPTSATPTPTTSLSPTPTTSKAPSPTLTPTPIPLLPPSVDTGLSDQSAITCVQTSAGGPCSVTLHLLTQGFPADATFRVAARAMTPIGLWQLASAPVLGNGAAAAKLDATVELPGPEPPALVQFAVLVFLTEPSSLAPEFHALGETRAEFAFVTPTLAVEIERDYPLPSPTDTAAPEGGPQITYFGVARADDVALNPTTFDRDGRPIYERPTGQGMFLVIEARPGSDAAPVGLSGYDPNGGLPDVQILVSQPLGDGSAAVCSGGVPATGALRFSDSTAVVNAINDLGCHVNDGAGNPVGRNASSVACTRSDAPGSFGYGFVDTSTTTQFCLPISSPWSLPAGDTIIAARVRDSDGRVGLTQQIVVRVGPIAPSPTQSPLTPPVPTLSPTSGPTPPPTSTAQPGSGPEITYIGITRSDYVPVQATALDQNGLPIFDRTDGAGLVIVVEARPGSDGLPVGPRAFDAQGGAPDLQLLVSRPLGDGSAAVCDKTRPNIGGVPATAPLAFSDAPAVVDAMNDLGCRASNGAGDPVGIQLSGDACTLPNQPSGEFAFVDPTSTIQFCLPVAAAWPFMDGETIVAARLRDVGGVVGLTRQIVVRIGAPTATPTGPSPTSAPTTPSPTASPTRTPTATGTPLAPSVAPQITYFGVARPDDVPMPSTGVDVDGRPIYVRGTGQGMFLVIEARPGSGGQAVGAEAFDATGGLPDLQMLVSRPLGNGSAAICDDALPNIGGVPATDPLEFTEAPSVVAAINDLGCRVNDGAGNPIGRTSSSQACTRTDAPGTFGYGFIDPNSTIQYCMPVAEPWGFPLGDTIVAARVRDASGGVGVPQEIVVRVTGLP
jgi:hypothetical protein